MLDHDGSVRACVDARRAQQPDATFAELEASCFPGRDGELALFAISPRHLEACATRTAQILVDGEYNGILKPGEHYLELRRDLSNLDDVLDIVAGERDRAERIADRAHRDVVASGRFTFRRLVEDVERELGPAPAGRPDDPRLAILARRRRCVAAADPPRDARRDARAAAAARRARVRALRARTARRRAARRSTSAACWCSTTGRSRRCSGTPRPSSSTRTSFRRHSRLGVVELNMHAGIPAGAAATLSFDAVILHYSLFASLPARRRVPRLPAQHRRVQGRVLPGRVHRLPSALRVPERARHRLRVHVPGAASTSTPCTGATPSVPTLRTRSRATSATTCGPPRPVRQARRAAHGRRRVPRPAAPRLPRPRRPGEGADRPPLPRARRRHRAAARHQGRRGRPAVRRRLVPLVANCAPCSGVESGASAFDLEDEVIAEYRELVSRGVKPTVDDLRRSSAGTASIDQRTISPRHFEAAALRVCQVLFEGHYAGVMEPMRHYIPLRKDFSNFDEVVAAIRDAGAAPRADRERPPRPDRVGRVRLRAVRGRRRRDARRRPASARCATRRRPRPRHARPAPAACARHVRGGLPELLRAEPARRLMHVAEPVTLRVRR